MNPPAASAARSLALLPYAALALTSLLIVGGMLYYAPYGLDFTDESFYLNWLKHPHDYAYSVTQFGFIYHPLYELLSGDIATLRRINILLTFGLAWWLSSAVLRYSVAAAQADALWRPVQMLAVSAALATCVLAAFTTNHRIPNYNLLTLQALMLTTCGVLLAQRPTRSALVSGFIVGLGGTLCFIAKPTSALALCPLVLLWLAIRPRRNLPVLAVSALSATTSLASLAWLIDGSPIAFLGRLQGAQRDAFQLGGGHDWARILRIDTFTLHPDLLSRLYFLALGLAVISALSNSSNRIARGVAMALSMAGCGVAIYLTLGTTPTLMPAELFQGLLAWGVVFGVLPVAIYYLLKVKNGTPRLSPSFAGMLVALLCLPHAYALGTNNYYWHQGWQASFFWIMAGAALLAATQALHGKKPSLVPMAAAAQLLAATLLGMHATTPYRQPQPLWTNTEEATIGVPAAAVKVSADIGRYLRDISDTAKKGEFQPGTPVIDMSGQSPIVPYTLGGKPAGAAWLIGGYPRSLSFAANTLRLESCEDLASAWLLREPGGPRSLADSLLDELGLGQPDSDFELVGEFDTPPGGGGYAEPRRQQLFKPRAPQLAMENCLRKRAQPVN
ncbi:hypothetical protein BER2_4492 [plant metagenome]|uniref:Transmembrane protein n=1 Tax=plant metagenome TaxID=1297885 RepID=A0A484RQV3_9ZZZZ